MVRPSVGVTAPPGAGFYGPAASYRSRCGRTRETWPAATGPALQRAAPLYVAKEATRPRSIFLVASWLFGF
jgi:hypothetical protein